MIEEGKLLYKIRETEREIDRLYQDLGRAVYEADEDMEVSFEEYTSDKTEQIDSQKEKLAELRGALADRRLARLPRLRDDQSQRQQLLQQVRHAALNGAACFRRRSPRLREPAWNKRGPRCRLLAAGAAVSPSLWRTFRRQPAFSLSGGSAEPLKPAFAVADSGGRRPFRRNYLYAFIF